MPDDAVSVSFRISPDDVTNRSFATVRRGFDPQEVRAYLESLARELLSAQRREQELRTALSDAEERARHPEIDEALLTSSLGQRSAALLRSAHEEAARITQQAEEAANGLLREAHRQATETEVAAESSAAERIAEAELGANTARQQARDDASGVLETARLEAEAIVERARDQGRGMLDQAQEARRRVLADMAVRRRAVTDQIEQFRAARDQIAGSVLGVRAAVDRIVENLEEADDAARSAAAAATHAPRSDDERSLVLEAEQAAAEIGVATGLQPVARRPARTVPEVEATGELPRLRAEDVAVPVGPEGPTSAASGPAERDGDVESAATEGATTEPGPAATTKGSDTSSAAESPAEVDVLFARLRAAQPGDVTVVPGEPPAPADVPEPDAAAAPEGVSVDRETAEEDDEEPGEGDERPAELEAALTRRAEILEPIVTALARRLKRALQDDQNRLLDRLRQGTGEWHDDLLVDEESQRELYRKASASQLRDAVGAGIGFARSIRSARGHAPGPEPSTVDALSEDLAANVVTLLRRRLESGGVPDAAERIGAAYREWRGERIERLAEDRALDAFGAGVLRGSPRGTTLVWVTGDGGPGCADCDDNALAGEIAVGEEFPTGHRHPPAHAGCRCLVLPTSA